VLVLIRNEGAGILVLFHGTSISVVFKEEDGLRIGYWDSAEAFQRGARGDIRKTT
jgi:hypothetical protein